MFIVNTIRRVFGLGNGIDRNPQKANDLITEQIGLTMRAVNKEFKQDSLFLEIEREKLKLSLEFKDFKEKFEKGEFNTEEKQDKAIELNNQFEKRMDDLAEKVQELASIKSDIKSIDKSTKEKAKEFDNELHKHKVRSLYEFERGI